MWKRSSQILKTNYRIAQKEVFILITLREIIANRKEYKASSDRLNLAPHPQERYKHHKPQNL